MKKYFSLIIVSFCFFFLTGITQAEEKATLVSGPIFKTGESIYFTDSVDGDVFLLGGEVTVNATISGDLIILAGQTNVKGEINGDLRIISGRADIDSTVNDDASLISAQLKITQNSIIRNTLTAVAKILDFNGKVANKTILIGDKVHFSGQAQDQVSIIANQVTANQDAKIANNLKIQSYSDPDISRQAIIGGDIITIKLEKQPKSNHQSFFSKIKPANKFTLLILFQQLTTFTIELLIGSLLLALFPLLAKKLVKLSQQDPGLTLGWGFLSLTLLPLLGIFFILSLIGIPLGVLVFILYGFSIYTAKLIVAQSLGVKIFKDSKFTSPYKNLSLGLAILTLLKLLPIIGWLAYFLLILNGFGAITLLAKDNLKRLRK